MTSHSRLRLLMSASTKFHLGLIVSHYLTLNVHVLEEKAMESFILTDHALLQEIIRIQASQGANIGLPKSATI